MPNLFRHPIIKASVCLACGMLKQVQHDIFFVSLECETSETEFLINYLIVKSLVDLSETE
jgi:hypothetical protein